jgi:hypothetical protein
LAGDHAPRLKHELDFLEAFGAVHAGALGGWLRIVAQALARYAIPGSLREPLGWLEKLNAVAGPGLARRRARHGRGLRLVLTLKRLN